MQKRGSGSPLCSCLCGIILISSLSTIIIARLAMGSLAYLQTENPKVKNA